MSARLVGLLLISSSAVAHDFWIQPDSYRCEPGIAVPVTLQVGHGPSRQRSELPLRRIARFAAVTPDGTAVDLRGGLNLGASTEDGAVQFQTPGTYVVVLETDNHARTLDGLESYSRHSKALIQVGSAESVQATQPLGMVLEIVPDVNPYSAVGALPIHVWFAGAPLAGARVELTNLEHDAQAWETHLTGSDGRASFAMPEGGKWLLNVVWKERRATGQDSAFETYFSSLSFGR
jgi:uncharacterized GH25 family protein